MGDDEQREREQRRIEREDREARERHFARSDSPGLAAAVSSLMDHVPRPDANHHNGPLCGLTDAELAERIQAGRARAEQLFGSALRRREDEAAARWRKR